MGAQPWKVLKRHGVFATTPHRARRPAAAMDGPRPGRCAHRRLCATEAVPRLTRAGVACSRDVVLGRPVLGRPGAGRGRSRSPLQRASNTMGSPLEASRDEFHRLGEEQSAHGALPRSSHRRRQPPMCSRPSPARSGCDPSPTSRVWSATSRTARGPVSPVGARARITTWRSARSDLSHSSSRGGRSRARPDRAPPELLAPFHLAGASETAGGFGTCTSVPWAQTRRISVTRGVSMGSPWEVVRVRGFVVVGSGMTGQA